MTALVRTAGARMTVLARAAGARMTALARDAAATGKELSRTGAAAVVRTPSLPDELIRHASGVTDLRRLCEKR